MCTYSLDRLIRPIPAPLRAAGATEIHIPFVLSEEETATMTDKIEIEAPGLEGIRARAAAATPGPWFCGSDYKAGYLRPWEVCLAADLPMLELRPDGSGEADATFIAHAREDVPALLSEVDRLTAETEELRRTIRNLSEAYHATTSGCAR